MAALAAYALAVGAALLTGQDVGAVNERVEGVSSTSGALLGRLAAALPLGYAFGAGMVAAVNPCGIAMLPAYIGLYLGTGDASAFTRPVALRLLQALWVGAAVTAGFVALFGAVGLTLGAAGAAVVRVLPWAGLVLGLSLVWLGGRLLGGGTLYAGLGERLADRLGSRAGRSDVGGYVAYGLAYGLASLSCTLPIFLAVVGGSLAAGGLLAAAAQFVLYALGMGLVVTLLTIAVAFFQHTVVTPARQLARYLEPTGAVLLLLAGTYITYYWLTLGGLLARIRIA